VIMPPRTPVLFVTWRSPKTHSIIPVGRLIYRDDKLYEFAYINKAQAAVHQGFMPFLDFPYLGQFYLSHQLFPLFANRVLPVNRPEFREYIRGLGLSHENGDPMHILARTGGRRETDQIEMFPLPLPDPQTGAFATHCLIRGIRYMPQPVVDERIAVLRPHEPLLLLWDAQNTLDPTALAVRTLDCVLLGYLPAYLNREMWELLSSCPQCQVHVERVNPPPAGVHHRLLCRVDGCWPEGYIPFSTADYQPINTDATDIKKWFMGRKVLDSENRSTATPGSVAGSSNIRPSPSST
jgi:hypothetical protein